MLLGRSVLRKPARDYAIFANDLMGKGTLGVATYRHFAFDRRELDYPREFPETECNNSSAEKANKVIKVIINGICI